MSTGSAFRLPCNVHGRSRFGLLSTRASPLLRHLLPRLLLLLFLLRTIQFVLQRRESGAPVACYRVRWLRLREHSVPSLCVHECVVYLKRASGFCTRRGRLARSPIVQRIITLQNDLKTRRSYHRVPNVEKGPYYPVFEFHNSRSTSYNIIQDGRGRRGRGCCSFCGKSPVFADSAQRKVVFIIFASAVVPFLEAGIAFPGLRSPRDRQAAHSCAAASRFYRVLCVTMIGLIILGISLAFLVYVFRKNRKTHRLPPGPSGIPLFGYLPWIDPVRPHVSLTELARKYGPICGLRMGSVYTILLSDPQLVKQTFAKDAFAGRAPLYLTHGIMQGYGLICTEGDLWRDQRRFVAGCLKNFGMTKLPGTRRDKMEERILTAVNECTSKLKNLAVEDGIDPLETLHHCIGNIMNDLVFGKVYKEDDEMWKWLRHLQEEGVKHIGVAGPLNFLPFLRFLPRYGKIMESLIDGKLKTHQQYQTIIDEHRARREKTDTFLAAFDEAMSTNADNGYFTQPQFYHLLADLFGAGTDTSLTTFRWFLLFMATHPDEQKKIQDEMNELLGPKLPGLEDRLLLIQLEAAIAETQRLRSIVPVGIPHGTIEDTQIGDYDVPKGTMVIPLQWAIHTDPSYWHDPLSFKPERFIAEDGSLAKPKAFLPYQAGKRMCVGDELAKMILFLFAARLLHSFVISVPSGAHIDMEGECGITLVPKPYRLVFTSRE